MKTINLVNLVVSGMYVDIVNQKVIVNYIMTDADGVAWTSTKQETYWVTMPETPLASDQQLPQQYLQNLVDLYNVAKADLTARYLV